MGNIQQRPAAIASPAMRWSSSHPTHHLHLLSCLQMCQRLELQQGHYSPSSYWPVPCILCFCVTETFSKVLNPSFFRSRPGRMKEQLCGFQCFIKHMCFQVAGQDWNSPRAAGGPEQPARAHSPSCLHCLQSAWAASLPGPRPETLKGCQLLSPPPPPSIINPTSPNPSQMSQSQWRPALATLKVLKPQPRGHFRRGGGLLGREGGAEGRGGGSLILPRPVGSSLQHSGSTHPRGQDSVSAESSFLVQRDPGLKPHSWWGLNVAGNGSILSYPPPKHCSPETS